MSFGPLVDPRWTVSDHTNTANTPNPNRLNNKPRQLNAELAKIVSGGGKHLTIPGQFW